MVAIETRKKRTRLVNPEKPAKKRRRRKNAHQVSAGPRAAKKRTRRKANPGQLVTLGLVNPQKKGKTVKKRKNGKKTAARRRNPVVVIQPVKKNGKRRSNPKRRRNPSLIGTSKDMVQNGAYALAGLVAARQIPQLVLKENNTGWKGYLANAAAAIASAFAAGKFVGPAAANSVLVGGGLYLVNRVLTEQFSPVGRVLSLSGVGDAAAASTLGRIRPGYFPIPTQFDQAGKPIIPPAIVEAVKASLPAPAAAAAASKVSGVARAVAPRF